MLRIKDLKDLSFLSVGVTIDMQDLKDLKRFFDACARGGQAPALRFARPSPFHRRARACPSPCLDRNRERLWAACDFRAGRAIAGDRPPPYG